MSLHKTMERPNNSCSCTAKDQHSNPALRESGTGALRCYDVENSIAKIHHHALSTHTHCGNSCTLPAVHINTITYELDFLLLTDQHTFSLKNKYIHVSTTCTYRRYWRIINE